MTRVTMLRMSQRADLATAIEAVWDRRGAVWVVDAAADAARIRAMGGGVVDAATTAALVTDSRIDIDLPVPADTATIVTSSGTTGQPKLICLSGAALDASAAGAHSHLGIDVQDRWLLVLPLHHIAGQSVLWRSRLLGTRPLVQQRLDVAAANAAGVTVTSLVPTQLRRVVESGDRLAGQVLLGGAAIAPALLTKAVDHVAGITRSYGLTETAGGCVYDGVPFPGTRVRVRDGLLGLRSTTMASGCLSASGMQSLTDDQGWLWTNDLGAVDTNGVVSVTGRADDIIVTGGVNVNPASVEVVLEQHPGIARAGVVGVHDEEWGQRLVAVLVLQGPERSLDPTGGDRGNQPGTPIADTPDLSIADPGLAGELPGRRVLDELRALVKRQLGPQSVPKNFIVVDTLPLTALGKVARAHLPTVVAATRPGFTT